MVVLLLILLLTEKAAIMNAFTFLPVLRHHHHHHHHHYCHYTTSKHDHSQQTLQQQISSSSLYSSRYGPPLDDLGNLQDFDERKKKTDNNNNNNNNSQQQHQNQKYEQFKKEFRTLLDQVLTASKAEHVPSLLVKHTQLLLQVPGYVVTETIQEILAETTSKKRRSNDNDNNNEQQQEEEEDEQQQQRIVQAIDTILSFTEDFVQESKRLDDDNKQLLGKIIRTMTTGSSSLTSSDGTSSEREEEELDRLLLVNKDKFTSGFLRHLDGEVERIAAAPTITKESQQLQQILLVIKARIVEELGRDLGEAAQVLGQLIAYDSATERMAVLDAGLQVRGLSFAHEMLDLTREALQGFYQKAPGVVDETLIQRVQEIDTRIRSYVEDEEQEEQDKQQQFSAFE